MDNQTKRNIVEAIDDGRIVRVPEEYAIREGLLILRKKEISFLGDPEKKVKEDLKKEMRVASTFDSFRRPLRQKNDIASTLIENFHWILSKKRKAMNINRKQLADKIHASELDIKMIENGALPTEDYILVNKLEQFYGFSLRKEGVQMPVSLNSLSKAPIRPLDNKATYKMKDYREVLREREKKERVPSDKPIVGDDIEIEF